MAATEDYNFFWYANARKNRAWHVARIHQTSVRNEVGLYASSPRSFLWGGVLANLGGQFSGIGGIKTAGNGGKTNHFFLRTYRALEGFPLSLMTCRLAGSYNTVTLSP